MRHLILAAAAALLSCNGGDKQVDDSTPIDDSGGPGVPADAWAWCPDAAPSGDAAWTRSVDITEGALLCGTFHEGRTLLQEIDKKAQLRLMPGALTLPAEDVEDAAVSLPACLMLDEGQEGLTSQGEAALSMRWTDYDPDLYYQVGVTQPMQDSSGAPWTLRLWISGLDTGDIGPVDGSHPAGFDGPQIGAWLCEGVDCEEYERFFDSCRFESTDVDRHTFTFEGGELELDLRIGVSMAGTEPGTFTRASGTLDGATFSQTDYWKLVYNPEHHHFSRDAIVFFDEEISGACGVSALNFEPWDEAPPTTIQLVDCAGQPIEERAVLSETWEIVD